MVKTPLLWPLVIAFVLATLISTAVLAFAETPPRPHFVPRCAEDVVIVGKGNYSHGYWSRYVCGPALDNFK